MSTITDAILADADAALAASLEGEPRKRLTSMTHFMMCFERLAREVAKGNATWDEARPWALRNAERLCATEDTMSDWEVEMGRTFYHGGEEEAERALKRRSQHAFARELFRGTPADDCLAAFEAEDVDHDFQDEAERLALDAPDYVPRTHTWWRWRDPT